MYVKIFNMEKETSVETSVNNSISVLAYISQIRSNFLLHNELETLCLELYNCLKTLESSQMVEIILTCVVNVKKFNLFTLNNFRVLTCDSWFFRLVLLASLRHSKEIFSKKDLTITLNQKRQILQEAMLTFQADKIESVLMLRLIEKIIKKNKYLIDADLSLQLLLFCQKAAISPIEGCKNYVHNISKIALNILDSEYQPIFLKFNLLPIKGIETLELVPYFSQASNNEKVVNDIITKVIQMFSNNIENREGGFLYKSVLFEDFHHWKELIWPKFFIKFQTMDFEGEFFQSLVKYWIPQCISKYKLQFYTLIISTIPISNYLKGHVLLETRRKGLIEEYNDEMIQLLSSLFVDNAASKLGLKIVSSYFRRNLYPSDIELQFVNSYVYGRVEVLDSEELKCLHKFLSQIGVVGSELYNLEVQNSNQEKLLINFNTFVMGLFTFCLNSLKTSNKDVGAQILMLFWKLTNEENPYLLNYKLNKGSTSFYHNIFQHKQVYNELIEKAMMDSNRYCPELITLGRLVSCSNKLYPDDYLMMLIDDCTKLTSTMATESVKKVSRIIVSQNQPKENSFLLQTLFDAIKMHFENFSLSLKGIFKGVLLFEAILEVSRDTHWLDQEVYNIFEGFDAYGLSVLTNILRNDIVGQIYVQKMEKDDLATMTMDQQYNLLCKIKKIVESLFNNVLLFIIQDRCLWKYMDMPKTMNLLVEIIETSNMRRPTTLSAEALMHIAKLTGEEIQKKESAPLEIANNDNEAACYKIKLLHSVLQKLLGAASVQNLTIRKNPESRLIIHALCQGDVHLQKPILTHTLHCLLGILSNPQSSNSTVSSAMHCIEILVSDNTLYNHTLRFIPDIITQCVEHFRNRNWIVRNANIQLARALIDRLFGVLIGHNRRLKSVEDLFCLFPQVITSFYQTLSHKPWTDSALIVMQIFSESQIRRQPFNFKFLECTREVFFKLFIMLIKDNSDQYGTFAVRAYTSLCLEEEIPYIIKHVVDFITESFLYIKEKHTIKNFVLLLNDIYDKFLVYINDFPTKPDGYFVIQESFQKLSVFLKKSNVKQCDLLSLKILSIDEVMSIIISSNLDISDYRHRIWLHNYMPFVFINARADLLANLLKEIAFKNVLDFMHVKILSILVDRYYKNHLSNDNLEQISNTLIQTVLITNSNCNYMLQCYFKVIFLFLKCNKTCKIEEYCIEEMRSRYGEEKNIYKICVVILLIAKLGNKNYHDNKFIKTAIQCFVNLDLKNFEMAELVSDMLPHLYANVCCACDKYQIFKIALVLIIEHGFFDFVSFITKPKVPNALIAMVQILDFQVLTKSLENDKVACQFVKEFYKWVTMRYTQTSTKTSTTYYVEEKDIFVDKLYIDRIVLKFIRDFNKKKENLVYFRHYETPVKIKDD